MPALETGGGLFTDTAALRGCAFAPPIVWKSGNGKWYHHTMKTAARTQINTGLRDDWLRSLQDLQEQIKAWAAQEPDWTTEASETDTISEDALGNYKAPTLTIHAPDGELRVEPIARNFPGRGIVEVYAWRTLRRVRLIPHEAPEKWRVLTDSGIYLRQEWNRENFITLANDLMQAK